MLLNTREREREAIANHVVPAVPRLAPAVRAAPPRPAFPELANFFGRGADLFEPPVPEPPRREPPRPAHQIFDWGIDNDFDVNVEGDFDWIDDPSAYARFSMTFTIFI